MCHKCVGPYDNDYICLDSIGDAGVTSGPATEIVYDEIAGEILT